MQVKSLTHPLPKLSLKERDRPCDRENLHPDAGLSARALFSLLFPTPNIQSKARKIENG